MKKITSDKIFAILAFLGIYLLSTGVSYAVFNHYAKPSMPKDGFAIETEEGLRLDVTGPKDKECPLNGKMFTKEEEESWSKRRPLFVMIENHEEARPQSGLSKTDIVYEAVAEGGITRFGAIFYCDTQAKETIMGPVRSARTYFVDWASEYGPALYAHVGGAHCDPQTSEGCLNGGRADALGQIYDYGWEGENDLNQFSLGYPTFWRDYERIGHTVATEHTMYSTTEKLWKVADKRDWTNLDPEEGEWIDNFTPWSFKDGEPGGSVNSISFGFWDEYKDYGVKWEYDSGNNEYKRVNGGEAHKDLNTDSQVTTKNVVIQFAKESPANDGYPGNVHLLYGTTGTGKALVFQDGKVVKANWSKKNRIGRTVFTTEGGSEIEFVRGRIWIEVLPTGTDVNY
ncbi:hypothetical protein COT75_03735 [Candidatus Beckwithbacteria bacterium CG10_big_fil_rev_8_21_14_0_10_34_10]|uniref:DUF3048 domain-containing protein n=1 Tax=Candidatus Beckwithbacteria bacterium CG10_big_fil_rev_8_21_14_0_10_34_10 TaxID=1974495 RepID=A0A2H0WAK6_9BACT|nr:MAG: hypothetical protein COT75_03735 [Candidatus Beckwithbacteria bacterium CG10_big_fil_rev_8_21_14_0_10_34_10]